MTRYYVRVSTFDQKIDRQLTAYNKADFTYIDKMSGVSRDRPELSRLLNDLLPNDIVVVKSLDRLSRSTRDLLDLVDFIHSKKAFLHILDLNVDTSTSIGKFFLTIIAAILNLNTILFENVCLKGLPSLKLKVNIQGAQKGLLN